MLFFRSIVLSDPYITSRIWIIYHVEYYLLFFTLMCDEEPLTKEPEQETIRLILTSCCSEQTRALTNTIKIDTANKQPEEVVDEMLSVIHGT